MGPKRKWRGYQKRKRTILANQSAEGFFPFMFFLDPLKNYLYLEMVVPKTTGMRICEIILAL